MNPRESFSKYEQTKDMIKEYVCAARGSESPSNSYCVITVASFFWVLLRSLYLFLPQKPAACLIEVSKEHTAGQCSWI